jgi:Glycosyl transferases group 1
MATCALSDGDLSPVLANARLLACPSLYEGFGLPVVEAMAAGIPVACSNAAARFFFSHSPCRWSLMRGRNNAQSGKVDATRVVAARTLRRAQFAHRDSLHFNQPQ